MATRGKTLPTYDVFDEDRYFEPASENTRCRFGDIGLGSPSAGMSGTTGLLAGRRYRPNPAVALADAGADLLLNLSASPGIRGADPARDAFESALKTGRPVVYCNLAGGNDELVFDGQSVAYRGMES